MLLLSLTLSSLIICITSSSKEVIYDLFTGVPASNAEIKYHIKNNSTFWCIKEVEPCDPKEFRRIDGTCNNLKNPSRGGRHTPVYTILPPVYGKDFKPRLAENGDPLPSCRPVRTHLVAEGYVKDTKFTQLLTYALNFVVSDVISFHDTVKYILWKPYCCEPKGKFDSTCAPIEVPEDDPVHRFSDIRCMNLTVPETFQSVGCIKKDTTPEPIISNSPLFDLSHIYGNTLKSLYEKGRLFVGGLLKYEIEKGKIWPPSTKSKVDICLLNQKPHETRCHDTPEDGVNSLIGLNLFTIWIWRLHNLIATKLYILNTCWDDEKLFYVTRDIVIAIYNQLAYYEMWPALMGRENLIRDSVISSSLGFRNLYNENISPGLASEFTTVTRWAHMIQNMNIRMYDSDGNYMKNVKLTNITLRTGYLVDNIDGIAQGSFRDPSGKARDHIVDWDMSEAALYPHQRASDTLSADLCKSRLLGNQPYVAYREFCSGKSYETFDDLEDSFDPEQLQLLKSQYGHPRDIDVPSALWLEKFVQGGHVPLTFYCVVVEQLIHNMVSDRHWFELEDRPNAFTLDQLLSIRNMTVASVMCDVADSVTSIQPKAFLLPGKGNEICSCEKIQKLDLHPWKDPSCTTHKYPGTYY